MQFLHLGDHVNPASPYNFNLLCPISGLPLYVDGELAPEESYTHYGIPLPLLPEAELRRAFSNPRLWQDWAKYHRLTFTTRSGLTSADFNKDESLSLEQDPIETISIRPSRYGGDYDVMNPPDEETIPMATILDSPLAFAGNHQKLDVETSQFSDEDKARFLKAARATIRQSPDPHDLPQMSGLNLSGCFMNILARDDYEPDYRTCDDDQVYFRCLDAPRDTPEQVKAYLDTLPDHYLTYIVTRPNFHTQTPEINFHLFDLVDLER